MTLSRRDKSILIGNTLDHFDTSLYGFLAPLLAPLFFPNHDLIVQLILTYSIMASSAITRPLGALIFGWHALTRGPLYSLSFSLTGVAITTFLIGFIPLYDTIGWRAPFILTLLRMMKGLFAAGESTVAKLYIMEGKSQTQALKASYFYQYSSMLGIIMASGITTWVMTAPPSSWRLCFWLGGLTGLSSVYLRYSSHTPDKEKNLTHTAPPRFNLYKQLWSSRKKIIAIGLITSFSYITYAIPFVFMNSFVPLVTNISLTSMMNLNTILLLLDLFLIPLMGRLTLTYDPFKVMAIACFVLGITIMPLFYGLPQSSLFYVTFVRIWIVLWGVMFMCPLNFWLKGLFKTSEQYMIVGMGYAFGAAFIGRTLTPFAFLLWHRTHFSLAPAFLVSAAAFVTVLTLVLTRKYKSLNV